MRVRETDVTEAASRVSVHPKVREWMVARQREIGVGGGVVMEGRDIGTKVFPHADVKIFLDADPTVREQRRLEQMQARGASAKPSPPNSASATAATAPGRCLHWLPPPCRGHRLDQPVRGRGFAPGRRVGAAEAPSPPLGSSSAGIGRSCQSLSLVVAARGCCNQTMSS